jgi:hypothetical protein
MLLCAELTVPGYVRPAALTSMSINVAVPPRLLMHAGPLLTPCETFCPNNSPNILAIAQRLALRGWGSRLRTANLKGLLRGEVRRGRSEKKKIENEGSQPSGWSLEA